MCFEYQRVKFQWKIGSKLGVIWAMPKRKGVLFWTRQTGETRQTGQTGQTGEIGETGQTGQTYLIYQLSWHKIRNWYHEHKSGPRETFLTLGNVQFARESLKGLKVGRFMEISKHRQRLKVTSYHFEILIKSNKNFPFNFKAVKSRISGQSFNKICYS